MFLCVSNAKIERGQVERAKAWAQELDAHYREHYSNVAPAQTYLQVFGVANVGYRAIPFVSLADFEAFQEKSANDPKVAEISRKYAECFVDGSFSSTLLRSI